MCVRVRLVIYRTGQEILSVYFKTIVSPIYYFSKQRKTFQEVCFDEVYGVSFAQVSIVMTMTSEAFAHQRGLLQMGGHQGPDYDYLIPVRTLLHLSLVICKDTC